MIGYILYASFFGIGMGIYLAYRYVPRDRFNTAAFFICLGLSAYLGEHHGERVGFKAGEAAMYEQNFGNAAMNLYTWRKHMAALTVAER